MTPAARYTNPSSFAARIAVIFLARPKIEEWRGRWLIFALCWGLKKLKEVGNVLKKR